jgi:uncharacterized protein YbjT (DUF2867 family)
MKRILVTGATGNIGSEVIHYLLEQHEPIRVVAAVRDVEKAKTTVEDHPSLTLQSFDFEDTSSFQAAFQQVDVLFLLRPPQLADVEAIFRPLLVAAKENGITKVVFLSVQGAEKSKLIPHNQIEGLIQELKFNYIFVRPSYFMQNLTTTLLPEIRRDRRITLPSGKATFNWIDVKNIGEATAKLLADFEQYKNRSFELTGTENKNFEEVAQLMTEVLGQKITFNSVNPISFYFKKRREGLEHSFAIVMTILHFLPRLQKVPKLSDNYQRLTGKTPTALRAFLEREQDELLPPL